MSYCLLVLLKYGDQILFSFNPHHSFTTVHMPDGVSFVDAAGCVGDAVKAFIALHYMGHLGGPDDTGEITSLFRTQCFNE